MLSTARMEAVEAKTALAQAMHALQQTEAKLKVMEEDFNRNHEELEKISSSSSTQRRPQLIEAACQTATGDSRLSLLEQQVYGNHHHKLNLGPNWLLNKFCA